MLFVSLGQEGAIDQFQQVYLFNPLILQRNESVKYLTLSCRFFLTDLINFNSLITFLMVNNIFMYL